MKKETAILNTIGNLPEDMLAEAAPRDVTAAKGLTGIRTKPTIFMLSASVAAVLLLTLVLSQLLPISKSSVSNSRVAVNDSDKSFVSDTAPVEIELAATANGILLKSGADPTVISEYSPTMSSVPAMHIHLNYKKYTDVTIRVTSSVAGALRTYNIVDGATWKIDKIATTLELPNDCDFYYNTGSNPKISDEHITLEVIKDGNIIETRTISFMHEDMKTFAIMD